MADFSKTDDSKKNFYSTNIGNLNSGFSKSDSTSPRHHGHRISMADRAWMQISGVLEVISFDPEEIVLDTEEGRMQIKGTNLQVKQLAIESGELEIEGRPNSISYTEVKKPVTTASVFSRIFR